MSKGIREQLGIKVIKSENLKCSVKGHALNSGHASKSVHASNKTTTGQASILHGLKFDFNASSPVVGRQRNSYEQNKERIAKIIGY